MAQLGTLARRHLPAADADTDGDDGAGAGSPVWPPYLSRVRLRLLPQSAAHLSGLRDPAVLQAAAGWRGRDRVLIDRSPRAASLPGLRSRKARRVGVGLSHHARQGFVGYREGLRSGSRSSGVTLSFGVGTAGGVSAGDGGEGIGAPAAISRVGIQGCAEVWARALGCADDRQC